MASHEFVAYVDESGDDGLDKFRSPGDTGGSSNWLVIGCCIVRRSNDLSLVGHRDQVLTALKRTQTRALHFTKLNHAQRTVVVEHMAHMPIRVNHVICCKRHIPNPVVYSYKSQLYWYLCRTLIERISWFCYEQRKTQTPVAKIVFSTRGGMKYSEFRNYLVRLRKMDTRINWNVISPNAIETAVHSKFAGLQLADATCSAFAAAVEPNMYGNYEQSYARTLKPIVYRRKGNFLSYGVKLRCDFGALDARQNEFLEFYGRK